MFGSITTDFEDSLFDEFRRLQDEIDARFTRGTWPGNIRSLPRGAFPAVNVGISPDKVDVYIFAPGLDAKKIELSLQQDLLTVSGERNLSVDEKATYYRQERFSGEFQRIFSLPDDIDPEQVDARYRDGILQVSIRRRESAQPRQIEIH